MYNKKSMNFLLKIVEGPNKGAEIALVEGVSVTLGKGDDCDIVLADTTLPEAPVEISATADAVLAGDETLEPFHVKTLGATSLAVGPADAPWEPLVWPKTEEPPDSQPVESSDRQDAGQQQSDNGKDPSDDATGGRVDDSTEKPPRGRWRGRLVAAVVLLLLLLLGLARCSRESRASRATRTSSGSSVSSLSSEIALSEIADRYGLSLAETNGTMMLSGNLKTRRERLAATAEAYQAYPGIDLDISDDESFRTAAEDAIFTLTEGVLKVAAATNRVLALVGTSPSPTELKRTLEALSADLPKLRDLDVSGVVLGGVAGTAGLESSDGRRDQPSSRASRPASRQSAAPSLPVCGILTVPYPCLVLRDGRRVMEGAEIDGNVILKIGSDSVIVTNSAGRLEWKP